MRIALILAITIPVLLASGVACGKDGEGGVTTPGPATEPADDSTLTPGPSPPPSPEPTLDADAPPAKVTGVWAGAGGGSGEIAVYWSASREPDVDHYNVYRATTSGGPYRFLASVSNDQAAFVAPGMRGFIDIEASGTRCYVVVPVDASGNQGLVSDEACGFPPGYQP